MDVTTAQHNQVLTDGRGNQLVSDEFAFFDKWTDHAHMTTDQPNRTILPDARKLPRFAGVPTFCRFPLIENVDASHQPIDWALYGIPYDGAVTYQPGARFGPRAIRDASQYIKPVHIQHEVNIAQIFSMADAGDAPVRPYSCKETLDAACGFALPLGDPAHTKLLSIGGDHSTAYANIHATWQRRGKPAGGLALLHFDAHFDTADLIWDEKWTHGSPFIRAIEDGLIDPKRMLTVGIRGPINSENDFEFSKKYGNQITTYDQWQYGDGKDEIKQFLNRIGGDETYLSFDIDCIDPAFAPGTGTPCCGGFTSAEAFELLRQCKGLNIVGADVVEVLPARDPAGITSLLASHIIFEILALAAMSSDFVLTRNLA